MTSLYVLVLSSSLSGLTCKIVCFQVWGFQLETLNPKPWTQGKDAQRKDALIQRYETAPGIARLRRFLASNVGLLPKPYTLLAEDFLPEFGLQGLGFRAQFADCGGRVTCSLHRDKGAHKNVSLAQCF